MTKRFRFISGLPRSGSTLLSALLLQNLRFHAGMTNSVGSLFAGMVQQFSAGSEFGAVISREQRQRLSHGLFEIFSTTSNMTHRCSSRDRTYQDCTG